MNPKQAAGRAAADLVEDGMALGLGTGSTVRHTIERIGELVAEGMDLVGVPTSRATEALCKELKIPLTTLGVHPHLDLAVDGADEVDPSLNLIKGMGGALVREKIVAHASARFVIVVDDTKLVKRLGTRSALPVEVVPFGAEATRKRLAALRCTTAWRQVGEDRLVSDNGNYILDCRFEGIKKPDRLETRIKKIPGVVESGLFLDMADTVYVGSADGVEVKRRPTP